MSGKSAGAEEDGAIHGSPGLTRRILNYRKTEPETRERERERGSI